LKIKFSIYHQYFSGEIEIAKKKIYKTNCIFWGYFILFGNNGVMILLYFGCFLGVGMVLMTVLFLG
jgi:hypothetical protein